VSIECYAHHFWRGDVFPMWCFEADGGLGSPIFAVYPPLAHITTSFIYPISWAGASLYSVYVIAVVFATLLSAFGAYRWLTAFAGSSAALVGAILYVFMPYRSEVMVARSGLPELWVMAFAPFMAHELRLMLAARKPRWLMFSTWTSLSILAQPAIALCVLIGLGFYTIVKSAHKPSLMFRASPALVVSALSCLFYVIPAAIAMPYLQKTGLYSHHAVWSSRFILPLTDIAEGRWMHIIAFAVMAMLFIWLVHSANKHKRRIPHLEDRQEIHAWGVVGIASLMLLFPITKPFWDVVDYFTHSALPWRMQMVLGMAISLFAAVYVKWLLLPGKHAMAIGDMVTLTVALFCMEMFLLRTVDEQHTAQFENMVAARMVNYPEYRTKWTSIANYDDEFVLERALSQTPPAQVEMIDGTGAVEVKSWGANHIRIVTGAVQEGFTLRIHHRYFPFWHATTPDGTTLNLEPEQGSGLMLLSLPKGSWDITLRPMSRLTWALTQI
jgi:hypothetical protein